MHADGRTRLETVMEVVALHHSRHVVLGGQLDHAARAQRVAPLAVVPNLGLGGIQHQRCLFVIRVCICLDLFVRQRRTGGVSAGRVTNQRCKVSNQEDDRMAQILQLAHLVEHNRMTDMNIRCRRIQPQFDAQGFARGLGSGQLF